MSIIIIQTSDPVREILEREYTPPTVSFEAASLRLTPDAVARLYNSKLIYSDIVNTRGQNYAPFVGTAPLARDMLEITRAHGHEKLQS